MRPCRMLIISRALLPLLTLSCQRSVLDSQPTARSKDQSSFLSRFIAPTPDAAARDMVDVALPPGFPGTFGGLRAMGPKDIAQMMVGLSKAIDKLPSKEKDKVDAVGFYTYIPQIRGIYRDGKYIPELGQMYIDRIASITPELTKQWQDAMAAVASETPDAVNAMLQLMQCEPLWVGAEWNDKRAQSALSRLRSVPPGALKDWSKVSSDKTMVALSLVNTHALFDADAFNASLFQKAVATAMTLYDERAAKLK